MLKARRWLHSCLGAGALLLPAVGCLQLPTSMQIVNKDSFFPPANQSQAPELPAKDSARVCLATAESLDRKGKHAEAIPLYEKARNQDPRNATQVTKRLAVLYDTVGEFEQARKEYERALKQSPSDADVLTDLGYSCYCRGLWPEAEKHLRQALVANPRHPRAAVNLGLTLAQQERYAESVEMFKKAVSPAQANCNLGFILLAQQKPAEARKAYQDALALDPSLQIARIALTKMDAPVSESPRPATPTRTTSTSKTARPAAAPAPPPPPGLPAGYSDVIELPGPSELAAPPATLPERTLRDTPALPSSTDLPTLPRVPIE